MRTRIAFISALFLLFIGQIAYAQVTGVVQDGDGFPVADAEVTVKGTENSVYTGDDGSFSIDAQVGDQLVVVNSDGSSTEFPVAKMNMGTLNLASTITLTEAVVELGYFSAKKNQISSAVSTITAADLDGLNPTTTIDNMLQGKAAGVQVISQNGKPGQVAVVRVRGISSLTNNGPVQPLYVIDGSYMTATEMAAINPNDVESITVLKDAASTAIYGSRGAGGVVVVTTKKGKVGSSRFSVESSMGFGTKIKDPFDMMNARQKLDYEQGLIDLGITNLPSHSDVDKLLSYDHDWQDAILKTSITKHFGFQAVSGTETSSFLASFAYDKNTGIIEYLDGFERLSGRINVDQKLKHNITIGANIGMSYSTSDEPRDRNNAQNPFRAMYDYNPYEPVYLYDDEGNIIPDPKGNPWNFNVAGGLNILEELVNVPEERRYFRTFGNTYFKMEDIFTKGLDFKSQFGATYSRYQREFYVSPVSVLDYYLSLGGSKTDNGYDRLDYTWTNTLTYAKKFNENHNLTVNLLTEYNKYNQYSYSVSGDGFISPLLNVLDVAAVINDGYTRRGDYIFFGYGVNASYDYKEKYLFTSTFKREASSMFGSDTRYGEFFGLSAGWDIAREAFMEGSTFFDTLKLRGSYGERGSTADLPFYNITAINFGSYNDQNAATPSLLSANNNLTWEKSKSSSFALEFGVKRKLTASVEYFEDEKSDFITEQNLSPTMGSFKSNINAGILKNTGWEFQLNYILMNKRDFKWSIYGNLTLIDSKVKELFLPDGETESEVLGGALTTMAEGERPFVYKLVRYAGVDSENGDALYYDNEGNITNVYSDDYDVILKDKTPFVDYYGGFGTSIVAYGFDFGANFVYQGGNYIYNYMAFNMQNPANSASNRRVDAANYWQNPGDTNVLPRPVNYDPNTGAATYNQTRTTDQYLQDASYIRLRDVTLGYTFNKKLLGKTPLESVRIYVQGQNLATWTKFEGDPEVGYGSAESQSSVYVPGEFSLYSYPAVRSFLFGINVNF